jgi:hypothetical protein
MELMTSLRHIFLEAWQQLEGKREQDQRAAKNSFRKIGSNVAITLYYINVGSIAIIHNFVKSGALHGCIHPPGGRPCVNHRRDLMRFVAA